MRRTRKIRPYEKHRNKDNAYFFVANIISSIDLRKDCYMDHMSVREKRQWIEDVKAIELFMYDIANRINDERR